MMSVSSAELWQLYMNQMSRFIKAGRSRDGKLIVRKILDKYFEQIERELEAIEFMKAVHQAAVEKALKDERNKKPESSADDSL